MPLHSPDDIAALCNVSRATVYRSHRELRARNLRARELRARNLRARNLRARNLRRPLPLRFPLEEPDALRLIAYIKKRSRKKTGN